MDMWNPRVIVLGPGGSKGIQQLGFLAPLEDAGLLDGVDTWCGVSVGALSSLMLVAGYDVRDTIQEASKLDLFRDIGELSLNSTIDNKGIISNQPVRERLTELIVNKFGSVPTLHNLYRITGKALVTVTLNATQEKVVMMDPFTHPHDSCIDATMLSMNIPFLFYQLVYRGDVYVDGALANPYPIDYFDNGQTNILGVFLKVKHDNEPSPRQPRIVEEVHDQTLPMGKYAGKILQTLMDQRRNSIIRLSSNLCKHVCLMSETKDTTGYTVSVEDKGQMLIDGFNAGKVFLQQLVTNSYVPPPTQNVGTYSYPPYRLGHISH